MLKELVAEVVENRTDTLKLESEPNRFCRSSQDVCPLCGDKLESVTSSKYCNTCNQNVSDPETEYKLKLEELFKEFVQSKLSSDVTVRSERGNIIVSLVEEPISFAFESNKPVSIKDIASVCLENKNQSFIVKSPNRLKNQNHSGYFFVKHISTDALGENSSKLIDISRSSSRCIEMFNSLGEFNELSGKDISSELMTIRLSKIDSNIKLEQNSKGSYFEEVCSRFFQKFDRINVEQLGNIAEKEPDIKINNNYNSQDTVGTHRFTGIIDCKNRKETTMKWGEEQLVDKYSRYITEEVKDQDQRNISSRYSLIFILHNAKGSDAEYRTLKNLQRIHSNVNNFYVSFLTIDAMIYILSTKQKSEIREKIRCRFGSYSDMLDQIVNPEFDSKLIQSVKSNSTSPFGDKYEEDYSIYVNEDFMEKLINQIS